MNMCFHKGIPSITKCKRARLKREEAQELAELDVGNIIAKKGIFFCCQLDCFLLNIR